MACTTLKSVRSVSKVTVTRGSGFQHSPTCMMHPVHILFYEYSSCQQAFCKVSHDLSIGKTCAPLRMEGKALHPIGLGLKLRQLHGQRDNLVRRSTISLILLKLKLLVSPLGLQDNASRALAQADSLDSNYPGCSLRQALLMASCIEGNSLDKCLWYTPIPGACRSQCAFLPRLPPWCQRVAYLGTSRGPGFPAPCGSIIESRYHFVYVMGVS